MTLALSRGSRKSRRLPCRMRRRKGIKGMEQPFTDVKKSTVCNKPRHARRASALVRPLVIFHHLSFQDSHQRSSQYRCPLPLTSHRRQARLLDQRRCRQGRYRAPQSSHPQKPSLQVPSSCRRLLYRPQGSSPCPPRSKKASGSVPARKQPLWRSITRTAQEPRWRPCLFGCVIMSTLDGTGVCHYITESAAISPLVSGLSSRHRHRPEHQGVLYE